MTVLRDKTLRRLLSLVAAATFALSGCHAPPPVDLGHNPTLPSNVLMQDVPFHSTALARDVSYRVYRPATIPPGQTLPVVYLLHGSGGTVKMWAESPQISNFAAQGYLLVLMNGESRYWINAAHQRPGQPADRYEDFLTQELIAEVESRFPARRDRAHRAILGVSMGGFGAVVLALRHPDLYAFAGSLSGALDFSERHATPRFPRQSLASWQIFGSVGSPTQRATDPYVLAAHADPASTPFLFVTCGRDEWLFEPNVRFDALLTAHHIPHVFRLLPGGHSWDQWNLQLPAMLASLQTHVPPAPPTAPPTAPPSLLP